MDWQPIETAPRDGRIVLVWQDGCVLAAFFKKNKAWNAKQTEALQVIFRPGRHSSPDGWYAPTHWAPIEPPNSPPAKQYND